MPPYYQRGWDIGHESMKDGTPDFNKGSYYVNPVQDTFPEIDPELALKYPTFYGDNIFPAEVPEMEKAIKDASRLMVDVSRNVF